MANHIKQLELNNVAYEIIPHRLSDGTYFVNLPILTKQENTLLLKENVINNLTSTAIDVPLSAAQGKWLNDNKQSNLISGKNIKTINNIPVLGEGNISIPKGDKGEQGDPFFALEVNPITGELYLTYAGQPVEQSNFELTSNGNLIYILDPVDPNSTRFDLGNIKGPQGPANIRLSEADTRGDNQIPNWYMTKYGKNIITEFKNCSTIGVNNILTGTYCNVTTIIPWGDNTGGMPVQFAVNSSTTGLGAYRTSNLDGNAWNAWSTLGAKGDKGDTPKITLKNGELWAE